MHVLHRHQQRLVAEQEREDERAHAQEEEGAGTLESGEKEREDAGVGRVTTVVEEDEGEEPVAEDSGSKQAAAQTRDANVTVHTDAAKLAPTDATADQTPTSTIPNAATPEQPTKRKKRKSRRSKKREHATDSSGAPETPTAPAQPDVYEGMIPDGLPRAFRGIKVETAVSRPVPNPPSDQNQNQRPPPADLPHDVGLLAHPDDARAGCGHQSGGRTRPDEALLGTRIVRLCGCAVSPHPLSNARR